MPGSLTRWLAFAALGLPLPVLAQEPAPIVPLDGGAAPVVPFAAPAPPIAVPTTLPPAGASRPAPAPAQPCDCPPAGFDFSKVPPTRAARPGIFPMPPTGPGYYSIMDLIRKDYQKAPPKYGYPRFALMPPSFFDADFKYLDDPKYTDRSVSESLKRMRVGDDFLLSVGGSSWSRFMSEYNSRLGQRDNNYLLTRGRVYADLWYKDVARFYIEGISSFSYFQTLPKLPIDQSGPDFLNLFVDLKVEDILGKPVYARLGRQELTLGSQRLVSSLEWANTRRTFQGVSFLRTGEKWDATAFWLQPVIPNADRLDWADNQQHFAGGWLTYKAKPGTTVDLYNLTLVNNNTVVQRGLQQGNFTLNTTGARFAGDRNNFLWDFEGAIQLGTKATQNVVAGMGTAGVGYQFKDLPWTPTLWAYYDYASGGRSGGNTNTFNQLFPFGHYYFGWADLIGRQNIQDLNAHLYFYPAKWLTGWVQYHRFWLADSQDALYNAAGNATRRSANGSAGNDVGQEIDFTLNFHLSKQSDILVGYNYFFAGDFIRRTAAAGQRDGFDASTLFLQYNFRW